METVLKQLAALLFALMAGPALAEAPAVLKVGIDGAFPPFSEIQPDGGLKGFDVDIAQALCASMQVRCQLVRSDFDGMIPALAVKKLDLVVASMTITEERKRQVAFSDKYEGGYHVLYGKKNTPLSGVPASMKGKRIGALRGSVQETYLNAVFAPAGAQVAAYDDIERALMDLTSGRLDAILIEIGNANEFIKRPASRNLAIFGPKFNDANYFGAGSGIALRKGDAVLLKALNVAIKTIRANGVYKKINDKYFAYDQYE
jgi:lysine-arginine-ornithine-binding protein